MNLPDGESGLIDIYSMIILGLLWCEGDFDDKVLGLYTILRNPCNHNKVSEDCGSWNIVFPKLIKLATIFTYEQMDLMQQVKYEFNKDQITNKI